MASAPVNLALPSAEQEQHAPGWTSYQVRTKAICLSKSFKYQMRFYCFFSRQVEEVYVDEKYYRKIPLMMRGCFEYPIVTLHVNLPREDDEADDCILGDVKKVIRGTGEVMTRRRLNKWLRKIDYPLI